MFCFLNVRTEILINVTLAVLLTRSLPATEEIDLLVPVMAALNIVAVDSPNTDILQNHHIMNTVNCWLIPESV